MKIKSHSIADNYTDIMLPKSTLLSPMRLSDHMAYIWLTQYVPESPPKVNGLVTLSGGGVGV